MPGLLKKLVKQQKIKIPIGGNCGKLEVFKYLSLFQIKDIH